MSEEKKTVDRSKFKSTPVAATKQADEQLAEITGKKGGNGNKNAEYIEIKGEKNSGKTTILRIYPAHPDDGGIQYAEPKSVSWIPQLVAQKDAKGEFKKDKDGNIIKDTWAPRPLFNARVHGSQKEDIVEEYVKFAEKVAKDMYGDSNDEETKKKIFSFLEPVKGSPFSGSGKPKHQGILPKQTWVSYVDEITEKADGSYTTKFGRVEWNNAIRQRLNAIAANESSNDPLGTDPYTDLNDGVAIKVTYDPQTNEKKKEPQKYYTTEKHTPIIKNGGGRIQLYPISDESLEHFLTQTSLYKLFVNVYTTDTFDKAVAGLKHFDDEHELGVFEYDDFKEKIQELRSKLPEAVATEGEETTVETVSGDVYDKMNRDELKEFNKTEKLGIIPNKTMSDDDIRVAIRAAMELKAPIVQQEIEKVEDDEPDGPETEISKVEESDLPWDKDGNDIRNVEKTTPLESKPTSTMSAKDRIAALKNKGK